MSSPKGTLVLFPSAGMGHMIPFVELAKLLIKDDFAVVILVVDPPYSSPINSAFLSAVSSAHPSIAFHRLPVPAPPLSSPIANFQLLIKSNPQLSAFLAPFSRQTPVRALILDMFCTSALDVARDLRIPAYFFFASGASSLSAFVSIHTVASRLDRSFKDLGEAPLHFPGVPPIPASHMMFHVGDRESEQYKQFVYHLERLPKGDGILINTFEALERRAVAALRDQGSRPMPPVYCVGPVIAEEKAEGERHECLDWLDGQPRGSVVLLSFGSRGAFGEGQLREIAVGLERSGQRFLWVVRSPPSGNLSMLLAPGGEPDLNALMPEGFLERTKERGMVVKSWVPQTAVLAHEAVGAFVSHCGWNSTLEAVSAGVPLIAWPLYAEQRMNKVFLVEEAKLAVEMKGYDKELVTAEEVETKVRWVMESEGGRGLRDRAAAMKESAVAARKEGGSSATAWSELVRDLMEASN